MMKVSGALFLLLLLLAALLPAAQARTMGSMGLSELDKTKNMCNDCTKIVNLMLDMFSHQDTQKLVEGTFTEFCHRLPTPDLINQCDDFLKKYLPSLINTFLSFAAHKEGEICMILGLCAVQSPETPHLLGVSLDEGGLTQIRQSTGTSNEVHISPQCTFCLFIIKKIEDMLPKERTEESVVKLLEKICEHMPDHYQQQCNDFLENYGKQLIDFLLSSATPHTICMLLHLCLVEDSPPVALASAVSECELCRRLVVLTQVRLGHNSTQLQLSSTLRDTCLLHPNTTPGCKAFIERHIVTLLRILGKGDEATKACQVFFCSEPK